MQDGIARSSHLKTPLVYWCSSTSSSKLYLIFAWNAFFPFVGDPSYSFVSDWRRSRSTCRSIHMNDPIYSGTRDERSGILVKFNFAAKLRTDLVFCTPPSDLRQHLHGVPRTCCFYFIRRTLILLVPSLHSVLTLINIMHIVTLPPCGLGNICAQNGYGQHLRKVVLLSLVAPRESPTYIFHGE